MKLWILSASAALVPAFAWSGRPLLTDDSGTVAPGNVEFEAGALGIFGDGSHHVDAPIGLTMGVMPSLEAGAGFGAQWEQRRLEDGSHNRFADCSDLSLAAKWQLPASRPAGLSFALAPMLKLPLADGDKAGSGKTDLDMMGIASISAGERASAHINAGYAWIGDGNEDLSDVVHGGVAVDYLFVPAWQWVGEFSFSQDVETDSPWDIMANAGFRWLATEELTIDAAAGIVLHGDSPGWTVTAGMTWCFDWRGRKEK